MLSGKKYGTIKKNGPQPPYTQQPERFGVVDSVVDLSKDVRRRASLQHPVGSLPSQGMGVREQHDGVVEGKPPYIHASL